MYGNSKIIESPGRIRGHSLKSALKGAGHHEEDSEHGNSGHSGIPIERLRKGIFHEATKVTEDLSGGDYSASESRVSALTMAFHSMGK